MKCLAQSLAHVRAQDMSASAVNYNKYCCYICISLSSMLNTENGSFQKYLTKRPKLV